MESLTKVIVCRCWAEKFLSYCSASRKQKILFNSLIHAFKERDLNLESQQEMDWIGLSIILKTQLKRKFSLWKQRHKRRPMKFLKILKLQMQNKNKNCLKLRQSSHNKKLKNLKIKRKWIMKMRKSKNKKKRKWSKTKWK